MRYEPNLTLLSCVIAVVCSHMTYYLLDFHVIRNPPDSQPNSTGTDKSTRRWPWRKFSSATVINDSQYIPLVSHPDTSDSSSKGIANDSDGGHSLRVGTIDDEETRNVETSSVLHTSSSTPSFRTQDLSSDQLEAEQILLSECLKDELEIDVNDRIPMSKKLLAGVLLTIAIASMHYVGMYAMRINAVVQWNWFYIVLSVFLAWFFSAIAVLLASSGIPNRDFLSSLSQAVGIGGLHYTGANASTFYTKSTPSEDPTSGSEAETNRNELAFAVGMFTVSACFLACSLAAQATSNSRNRLKAIISAEKKIKKLTMEKEAAEKANEMKSSFVASVSHEIRTPMHAVNGFLEFLSKTKLTPEQQEYVEMIQNGSNILQNIINDILDFSKLESDRLRLQSHPFDIIAICESTVKATSTMASENVEVMLNVSPDCFDNIPVDDEGGTSFRKGRCLLVMGDLYRFQQIVMNIVSNALKFTVSGYVLVTLAPVITPGRDPSEVILRLSVEDSGPGISKEDQAKLFQPFSQLETNIARRFGGTGLGLVICKKLIQLKKGTIDVTSEINRGTTVTCEIPLRRLSPPEHLAYRKSISSRETSDETNESNPSETKNSSAKTISEGTSQRVRNITALLSFQSARTRDAIGQILSSTWGIRSVTKMEELELAKRMEEFEGNQGTRIWISDTWSLNAGFERKGEDGALPSFLDDDRTPLILTLPFHHRIGDLPTYAQRRIREGSLYIVKKPIVFQKLVDIITDAIEQPRTVRTQAWNSDDVLETILDDTRLGRTVSIDGPVATPEEPTLVPSDRINGGGQLSTSRSRELNPRPRNSQSETAKVNRENVGEVLDFDPLTSSNIKDRPPSNPMSPKSSKSSIPNPLPMKVPVDNRFKRHRSSSTASLTSPMTSDGRELGSKGMCLLVEDNPINVKLGTMYLRKLNYEVDVAEDGLLAIEKVESGKKSYDLILMDLQMPRMGGMEATRCIRTWESKRRAAGVSEPPDGKTRFGRIPIIALSANIYAQKECENGGFDDFLSKPLKMGDLQTTMDKLLKKQELTLLASSNSEEGGGSKKPQGPSV